MKNTPTTIAAVSEWVRATSVTMIAASVAPASGMRSRIATSRPSASANGTPTMSSTIAVKNAALPQRERDRDADDEQQYRRDEPGDDADHQVAGHIAADGLRDLARHAVR